MLSRSIFLLSIALLLAGCSAGEFTLVVVNHGEQPVAVTGTRDPMQVAAGKFQRGYVSRAEGTVVLLKSGDNEVGQFEVGKSFPAPDGSHDLLYYVGPRERLVLTDPMEFYAVDSQLDKAMAAKDPKVKLVAKIDESATQWLEEQVMLGVDEKVAKSVPSGSHYYRLVSVPEGISDDALDAFLQQEFKTAAGAK